MKTTSKLLSYLLATSCLFSCSSMNKNVSNSTTYNNDIVAGTEADLIQAQSAEQYYEIGRAYQKKAKYYQAVIAYQKSLRLDPGYTKSITGLATVFADQKLYIVSIPLFEQVTKLEPNAINYNNLGYAYYLNQQYAEANRVLTQAIMLEPDYVQAQKNLALVAQNQPAVACTDSIQGPAASAQQNAESNGLAISNDAEPNKSAAPVIQPQTFNSKNSVQTKIVQTGSSIYELNVESQTNIVAKTETADTVASKPVVPAKISKNIVAYISGGITFKHTSVMNKLFDLASNSASVFYVSDNSKFVEIVNGNGIKGIAKAVAGRFQESGNVQLKVADAKRFNQMKTHIQYKSGYRKDAVSLNHSLLNKPYLVRNDNLPNNIALRLVLGRDLMQGGNMQAIAAVEGLPALEL